VPDELPVHISREELHSLDVPESFEATGSFDLQLVNHGESVHIHVHLDDPLSTVASLDAGNHHVEQGSRRDVRVHVDTDRLDGDPLLGKLKVASAYGGNTRWIDVTVAEPEPEQNTVAVDESLAQPQPGPDAGSTGPLVNPSTLVLAVGAVALLVALIAAVVIQQTVVVVGSLVVLGGVLAALFFLSNG